MDTPGPFEKVATEAFFNVTLPDPARYTRGGRRAHGQLQSRNHQSAPPFTRPIPATTSNFSGCTAPTKTRKLLGSSSNAEGWAHYCEQMMLDEGYGQPGTGAKDARESEVIRLGQLTDALLRNARFIAGIEMHTGKMSFDQVVDFFVKEGYQSRETALVETKRGTSDPTYLYYTLGKLQILKLREDLRAERGLRILTRKVS